VETKSFALFSLFLRLP